MTRKTTVRSWLRLLLLSLVPLVALGCNARERPSSSSAADMTARSAASTPGTHASPQGARSERAQAPTEPNSTAEGASAPSSERQTAILAGGCFWGVEELFRALPGVVETDVGYTGGSASDPTYSDVKTGHSGHAESVRVVFDPSQLSYERLLLYFFKIHDPTTKNRQGNDVGTQYRSAIFVNSPEQRRVAQAVIDRVNASGDWHSPVTTEIADASTFTLAEEYHQDYLKKHPGGYTCHYERDVTYY